MLSSMPYYPHCPCVSIYFDQLTEISDNPPIVLQFWLYCNITHSSLFGPVAQEES